jgi:hypothetical protein
MVSARAVGDSIAAKATPKASLAAKRDSAPRIHFAIALAAIRIGNCFGLTEKLNLFTPERNQG